MTSHTSIRFALVLLATLPIFSCGGGGSGNGNDDDREVRLSRHELEFRAVRRVTPEPQTVGVTAAGDGDFYFGLAHTGTAVRSVDWRILSERTGEITIEPEFSSQLGPGQHRGTVILLACKDPACGEHITGSPAEIDVSYVVPGSISATPEHQTIAVNGSTTAEEVTASVSLNYTGESEIGFSATSDSDWLVVAPGDATLNPMASLAVAIDQASLRDLANGSHSAVVSIQPEGDLVAPIEFYVELERNLPEVHAVGPTVLYTGQETSVALVGSGFTHIPPAAVQADGVSIDHAEILHDSEMLLTLGPVADPGPVRFTVTNALNIPTGRVEAEVRASASYGHQRIEYESNDYRYIRFDPHRERVFLHGNGLLRTFELESGQWTTQREPLTQVDAFGVSLDGSRYLAVNRDADVGTYSTFEVYEIEPSTITRVDPPVFTAEGSGHYEVILPSYGGTGLVIDTDGMPGIVKYPSADWHFVGPNDAFAIPRRDGLGAWIGGSTRQVYRYTASSDVLRTEFPDQYTYPDKPRTDIDRHGQTVVAGARVYRGPPYVYAESIGSLGSPDAVAISPDGTTVLFYDASDSTIRQYDASTTEPSEPQVLATLDDTPTDFEPEMRVSPDGHGLFVFGDNVLYVIPLN